MRHTKPISVALVFALGLGAVPLHAKGPSPKKMMDMSTRCAYVVGIAEGNNVKVRYGSAEWLNIARILEQKFGVDSGQSLELAKKQYNKRARILGADAAFKHMLSTAKDCDREMAVIKS